MENKREDINMLGDIIVTVGDKVISEFFKIVKKKFNGKKHFYNQVNWLIPPILTQNLI